MADNSSIPEILDAAIADANRTLEMKNNGDGYFEVVSIKVRWMRYDPELDDVVPGMKPITYVP